MYPKVSVIIPCYNCEKYLDETLRSLDLQTYKEFEVVCINDGSTDGTMLILKKWKEKINLRILDQENQGVSRARNNGIEGSNGQYIMFCDADDCYHPQMIELLITSIENNNADTAYCFYDRKSQFTCEPKKPEIIIQDQKDAMKVLLYKMATIGFSCYIYRKDILYRERILFDCDTKHFEDREFNWKYLACCEKVVCVDTALYWYRRTEQSATSISSVPWRTDSIQAAKRVERYLKEKNCPYYKEVKGYLLPRVVWGMARKYAASGSKECFFRLKKEYNLDHYMRVLSKDNDIKVAFLSKIYTVHPLLYFYIALVSAKLIGKVSVKK